MNVIQKASKSNFQPPPKNFLIRVGSHAAPAGRRRQDPNCQLVDGVIAFPQKRAGELEINFLIRKFLNLISCQPWSIAYSTRKINFFKEKLIRKEKKKSQRDFGRPALPVGRAPEFGLANHPAWSDSNGPYKKTHTRTPHTFWQWELSRGSQCPSRL